MRIQIPYSVPLQWEIREGNYNASLIARDLGFAQEEKQRETQYFLPANLVPLRRSMKAPEPTFEELQELYNKTHPTRPTSMTEGGYTDSF